MTYGSGGRRSIQLSYGRLPRKIGEAVFNRLAEDCNHETFGGESPAHEAA